MDIQSPRSKTEIIKGQFSDSFWNHRSQKPYQQLFTTVLNCQQKQKMFLKHLKTFLCSRHPSLELVLKFCASQTKDSYFKIISEFLQQYLSHSSPLFLSEGLEEFLIKNIWTQMFRPYLTYLNIDITYIIDFLSLKMRSLEPSIRLSALNSLHCLVTQNSFNHTTFEKYFPQLIQKQTLSKNMSSSRGVILQILEDQLCSIKIAGIQFLGFTHNFFSIDSLRPLILYMLNDEHQLVRETSLKVLTTIQGFKLQKQDLKALLMCLKENNIGLRIYVYKNLLNINVISPQDFLFIFEKLFQTLRTYKIDKKKIYSACRALGSKYPQFVLKNIDWLYHYSEMEEPNFKNLIYKAKVITVASIGKNLWPQTLPLYFQNHYLYIRDIEYSAFNDRKDSFIGYNPHYKFQTFHINNRLQLQHFLAASTAVYVGFPKVVVIIMQKLLCFQGKNEMLTTIYYSVLKLEVTYNIEESNEAIQIIKQLKEILRDYENMLPYLGERLKKLITYMHQRQQLLNSVSEFVFKVSGYDRNCILISKNQRIIKQAFLQFHSKKRNILDRQVSANFIKMSQVEYKAGPQEELACYKIQFRWRTIKCFILYGENNSQGFQHHITDDVVNNQ